MPVATLESSLIFDFRVNIGLRYSVSGPNLITYRCQYLHGVWLDVDIRTNAINTCVLKRLGHMLNNC